MAFTNSPNMFLPIPGVGTEQGPNYAIDVNSCLTLVDQHDHSLGKGVQIQPNGLNINSNLTFNDNSATNVASIVFTEQTSVNTLQALYVKPGVETPITEDLWFNDGNGNQVQITSNGTVNATIASIPGESYAAGTFFWKQGALSTVPANFDIGSITLRPNVAATTFGVTLSPPSGITSQYAIALPLLPVANSFMAIDNSGIITATIPTANGITASNIANNTITAAQIANNTITTNQISLTAGITLGQLDPTILEWNKTTFIITTPSFAVRVATTVNGTLGTAFDNGSVVDGVTLATNDIILLKNQTTASDNGVYNVQASGTPVRNASYDTFGELNYAGVTVTSGTVNAGLNFFQNNILTSLSDAQSWSHSSTQTFTVPTNVNAVIIVGVGGGGGGGTGALQVTGSSAAQGGSGGAGSMPALAMKTVTPGEVLTLQIGAGGAGAPARTASTSNGVAGSAGSNTTITSTTVNLIFNGAAGGPGGTTATNTDNAGVPESWSASGSSTTGGGGGGGGTSTFSRVGVNGGTNSWYGIAASGGARINSAITAGGGGGGGGSGLSAGGAGGNGGTGGTFETAGSDAANGSGGGGGGGGAYGKNTGTVETISKGGNGGNGSVEIYWLGPPS